MFQSIENKIHSFTSIKTLRTQWQTTGERVVFTNGCFDLLHYGHIHYLAQAKALGTRLIVGLNADASIRRLKGIHRPIKEEQSRMYVLAALQCVDAVVLFEEDTPYRLIEQIVPDLLVKGGDWAIKDIVGADLVLASGGKVRQLPYIDGFSTTRIEAKIRQDQSTQNEEPS